MSSYPYPQDRHRDRKEKGEQPYRDDKESMSQERVEIDEESRNDPHQHRDPADHEAELVERVREITREARQGSD